MHCSQLTNRKERLYPESAQPGIPVARFAREILAISAPSYAARGGGSCAIRWAANSCNALPIYGYDNKSMKCYPDPFDDARNIVYGRVLHLRKRIECSKRSTQVQHFIQRAIRFLLRQPY
jgi:hypothetical protein